MLVRLQYLWLCAMYCMYRSIELTNGKIINLSIISVSTLIQHNDVAFGSIHPAFSTYGESISTCFNLFLGDTSAHEELSKSNRALGWYLFFLTYMSLQFFILLNILLAILVDAYIAVRSSSTLSSDIISELVEIFQYYVTPSRCFGSKKFISDKEIEKEITLLLHINVQHMLYVRKQMGGGSGVAERWNAAGKEKPNNKKNSTKIMPIVMDDNNGRRGGGRRAGGAGGALRQKKNVKRTLQDIMLPKMIDGEPTMFAADRLFLETAMKSIQRKDKALQLSNGNSSAGIGEWSMIFTFYSVHTWEHHWFHIFNIFTEFLQPTTTFTTTNNT